MGAGQQGVEYDGFMAAGGESGDDVRADEARTSGDEYTHGGDASAVALLVWGTRVVQRERFAAGTVWGNPGDHGRDALLGCRGRLWSAGRRAPRAGTGRSAGLRVHSPVLFVVLRLRRLAVRVLA